MVTQIEEEFMVDIDISDDINRSVATVYGSVGTKFKIISAFTGEDAVKIYNILTKKEPIRCT